MKTLLAGMIVFFGLLSVPALACEKCGCSEKGKSCAEGKECNCKSCKKCAGKSETSTEGKTK